MAATQLDDLPLFETEENDSRIYSRLLIQCRRGYPLWKPEVSEGPDGINIGDVGVLTKDGGFIALLNIGTSSEADRLNSCRGVPDNIQRIGINLRWDQPCTITADGSGFPGAVFIPINSAMPDTSRQFFRTQVPEPPGVRCQVTFSGSPEKTAALSIFPNTETAVQECGDISGLWDYAAAHHVQWMEFMRSFQSPKYNDAESLFLVTGFTKSKAWARALMKKKNGLKNCSVTFTKWDEDEALEIDTSPHPPSEDFKRRRSYGSCGDSDQLHTLFIHGFLISPRRKWNPLRTKPRMLDANGNRVDIGSHLEKGGSFLHAIKKGRTEKTPPSGGDQVVQGQRQSFTSNSVKTFDFLSVINNFILETRPTINVAITHDNILNFLCLHPDICIYLVYCTTEDFIRIVLANYCISTKDDCGFLELRSPSSTIPVIPVPFDLSQSFNSKQKPSAKANNTI
ncbi:hypothetical protein L218DRAFT_1005255 [Marasmius fiardii PR-910]|nr:hypothetical protein L218DRAFT_1005255 [Marasmius fiardii PR-910]